MTKDHVAGARRKVPRSRGAVSGLALIVLGAWGALIPFVGPYFNFSFTPDDAWHWTSGRGWLEVLPGVTAFVAGLLLLVSGSRTMTLVASWLGVAAGAWFAVGPQLQDVWDIGSPGQPAGSGAGIRALEVLALFPLLGVVIVYFAASAFGRLSVVSARDQRAAERREAEAQEARERETADEQAREAAAVHEREVYAAQKRMAAEAQERDTQDRDAPVATEHRASPDHRALGAQAPDHEDVPAGQQAQPTQGHTPQPGGPQHAVGPQGYGQQPQSDGASVAASRADVDTKPKGWLQRTLHRD